jgi:hypothetical protein
MKPLFVTTKEYHPSYQDYWNLIALSGFDTLSIETSVPTMRGTYIFTGTRTEFVNQAKMVERTGKDRSKDCRLIYYQIERPDSGPGEDGTPAGVLIKRQADKFLSVFTEVWTPYKMLARLEPRLKYVPMGSHPRLRQVEPSGVIEYDLAMIASDSARRASIFAKLKKSKYKIVWSAFGFNRAHALDQSRAMLAIHQTSTPLWEPQRVAICAAYKLPLFTEHVEECDPLVPGEDFLMAPKSEILEVLDEWLARPDLKKISESLYEKLVVQNSFERNVWRALEA